MSPTPQTHTVATPEAIRQFARVTLVFSGAVTGASVASRVASYVTNVYPHVKVTYSTPDSRQIVLEYTETTQGGDGGQDGGDGGESGDDDGDGDGQHADADADGGSGKGPPPPDPRIVLEETKRAVESLPAADYQMLTYQSF